MKKALSLILILALMLSCVTVTAFAETKGSKITSALAEKLADIPDGEKIETCVWLYYKHDAELIERKTYEECGLTAGTCMTLEEVDIYSKTYNRIVGELETERNKEFIKKTGVSDEDIVFRDYLSPMVILLLTKEQIHEIEELKEVQALDVRSYDYPDAILVDCSEENDLPYEPLDPILSNKIGYSLLQVMAESDDDAKLEVYITLKCNIDKEAASKQAIKECGYIGGLPLNMSLDEVYAYKAAYNRIIFEQESAVADSFVAKSAIPDEDIVYHGKCAYIIARLTKDQIATISAYDEVQSLDCGDAAVPEAPTESDPPYELPLGHYFDRFRQKYETQYDHTAFYRELYYHHNADNEIDWALIRCELNITEPMPYSAVIGNRVILHDSCSLPFSSGYALYDVKEDKFISAASAEASEYDGFSKAFDDNVNDGRLLGDIDGDGEITVIDATIIQRCDIRIQDFPEDDEIKPWTAWHYAPKYYSDFNRDGERDILDATCIMRYSVGLPYHINK